MNTQRTAATGSDLRDQVVRAADALFYERGIQSVGMDAVRDASGVSLKRLYALVGSKDELVVAVLRLRQQSLRDGLTTSRDQAQDARGRALSIFDFLDAWFCEPGFRGCGFINAFGELGPRSEEVSAVVRETKAAFREYVEELVRAAGGSPAVALQIVLLAEGAQTTAAISGDATIAARAKAAAAALLDADVASSPGQ
ncbi:TetR/AcrR family transcriptional regulator [Auraticoccus monumenti]|uniref:DNA-binding transcriptional regulator, AcrR family n=1 Tax=Auraticoccus monumenti TaxID=675864 RepID=A0A1G6T155_9ACTN|nr:TetR/AcrR family transcriptional regulator [Auraticoccus monumenti]SDD22115.1 DNA-binding transcriptional regulator, AcrR family [Auraticoccus monumenti]